MVKGIGGHCQFRSPTPWTGGQGRLQIQLRSTIRSRKIRASFSLAAHQVHTCPSGRLQIVRVNGQNNLMVDRESQNDFHRMAVLCVSSCHQHPPWVRCAPLHLSATKTWSCHGQTPHPQQCYCRQYSTTKGSFNSPEWWHRQGSLMHSYSATTT